MQEGDTLGRDKRVTDEGDDIGWVEDILGDLRDMDHKVTPFTSYSWGVPLMDNFVDKKSHEMLQTLGTWL